MADDARSRHLPVGDIVGPEFMPGVARCSTDHLPPRYSPTGLPDQQAHQAALGDRTGGEWSRCAVPTCANCGVPGVRRRSGHWRTRTTCSSPGSSLSGSSLPGVPHRLRDELHRRPVRHAGVVGAGRKMNLAFYPRRGLGPFVLGGLMYRRRGDPGLRLAAALGSASVTHSLP
jgi:hypothetical protein